MLAIFLTPFAHGTTSADVLYLRPLTHADWRWNKVQKLSCVSQSKLPPQFQGIQIQNLDSGSPLPSMHSSFPCWNRFTSQQTSNNNLHTQFHILTKVNKTYFQKINFHMVAIIKPFQDLWYSKNNKINGTVTNIAKGKSTTIQRNKTNTTKQKICCTSIFGKPV